MESYATGLDVARVIQRVATIDAPKSRYPVGWQGWFFAILGNLPASVRDRLWRLADVIAQGVEWVR